MAANAVEEHTNQDGSRKISARVTPAARYAHLMKYDDVPRWYQDNSYIKGYYRPPSTIGRAIWSIFALHNESLNIWSHLIGALWFSGADWLFGLGFTSALEKQWPLLFYRCSAAICFLCSSTFHTCLCVDEHTYTLLARVDYIGILIFMSSGGICLITLACNNHRTWSVIYQIAGGIGAFTVMNDILAASFLLPQNRARRAVEFGLFSSLVIIPLTHGKFLWGCNFLSWGLGYPLICLLLGVTIFIVRIPERFGNGSWDLLPSHSFFHIAVFLGSIILYRRFIHLFELL